MQLYQKGYLAEFDKKGRLFGFEKDYEKIESGQVKMRENERFIRQARVEFLSKLKFILTFKRYDSLADKYKGIRENKHSIHLCYYLMIREVEERHKFMKDRRIYRFLIDNKAFMNALNQEAYWVGKQIDVWLREKGEKVINNNPEYHSLQKFRELMAITAKVLAEVPDREFDHEDYDDYTYQG